MSTRDTGGAVCDTNLSDLLAQVHEDIDKVRPVRLTTIETGGTEVQRTYDLMALWWSPGGDGIFIGYELINSAQQSWGGAYLCTLPVEGTPTAIPVTDFVTTPGYDPNAAVGNVGWIGVAFLALNVHDLLLVGAFTDPAADAIEAAINNASRTGLVVWEDVAGELNTYFWDQSTYGLDLPDEVVKIVLDLLEEDEVEVAQNGLPADTSLLEAYLEVLRLFLAAAHSVAFKL